MRTELTDPKPPMGSPSSAAPSHSASVAPTAAPAAPSGPARTGKAADRPLVWESLVEHRHWQRLLAGLLTGNLDPAGAGALRAHVRECGTCRSDLAELAPAVAMLPLADPGRLQDPTTAPDEVYRKVMRSIRAERRESWRAQFRRRVLFGAGVLGLVSALAVALALLPSELVSVPARDRPVPLHAVAAGVNVLEARLTPRPWGVELRFTATGLATGERYQVSFVTPQGEHVPAGGVLGASDQPVSARVSGPLPAENATQVLVTNAAGVPVLHADLLQETTPQVPGKTPRPDGMTKQPAS